MSPDAAAAIPAGPVLAIDTATSAVNVAVTPTQDPAYRSGGADDGTVAASIPADRRHAELLVPTIRDVLAEAGIAPSDLVAIVAGIGPGLFTGLRVGVTTARSMAWALRVPVVGVSSLEVLAAPVHAGRVVAVLDARRGEVYWAAFERGTRCGPDRVDPPAVMAASLAPPVTLVGSGAVRHGGELTGPGVTVAAGIEPDPRVLLALGLRALAAGEGRDPLALTPNYLRRTDAEIAWDRRGA